MVTIYCNVSSVSHWWISYSLRTWSVYTVLHKFTAVVYVVQLHTCINSFRTHWTHSVATVQNSLFSIAIFRVLLITTRCGRAEFDYNWYFKDIPCSKVRQNGTVKCQQTTNVQIYLLTAVFLTFAGWQHNYTLYTKLIISQLSYVQYTSYSIRYESEPCNSLFTWWTNYLLQVSDLFSILWVIYTMFKIN